MSYLQEDKLAFYRAWRDGLLDKVFACQARGCELEFPSTLIKSLVGETSL